MAGTNERQERRSVVDEDGWEPLTPERGPIGPYLVVFGVALVALPLIAFGLTYLLMSR